MISVSNRLSIGEKIRLLREARQITQTELAERVGMDRATLAGYELNRRNVRADDIDRIADALGVAPGNFYDRDVWEEVQLHLRAAQAILLGEAVAEPPPVPLREPYESSKEHPVIREFAMAR